MSEQEHPQSLSAPTPRGVEGHELLMKVTGDEVCQGSKEYRKERSAEGIISSVLGVVKHAYVLERLRCLKTPISLCAITFLRMIGGLPITSPGNRHKLSTSPENPVWGVVKPWGWGDCSVRGMRQRKAKLWALEHNKHTSACCHLLVDCSYIKLSSTPSAKDNRSLNVLLHICLALMAKLSHTVFT